MKMKKGIKRVLGSVVLTGGVVFYCLSGLASSPLPKVEINGVSVYSPISYSTREKTMVDVNAFFNVMKGRFDYNKEQSTIVYRGEAAAVKRSNGGLVADVKDLADLIDADNVKVRNNGSIYILVLPEGTIKLSQSYKTTGEHWANPAEDVLVYEDTEGQLDKHGQAIPVFKTIYGVYQGELIFLEQMIAQTYMEGPHAKSWTNLPGMRGLPSPSIVQTDIEFKPAGHHSYQASHYDFHQYFITDKEQQKIKGLDLP